MLKLLRTGQSGGTNQLKGILVAFSPFRHESDVRPSGVQLKKKKHSYQS